MSSLEAKEIPPISCGAADHVRLFIYLSWLSNSWGPGKRESSAKFDPSPPKPYNDQNGQFAPVLTIECRGLEFWGFEPGVR